MAAATWRRAGAGASACLVEPRGSRPSASTTTRIAAAGLKAATGHMAAAYYGRRQQALDVVAITGTNGKTSTAWWLARR
jgi:UDP-N-acetylmuramoyl-L-alanyl-D-glutamate--2,6-diaminopimelate ligase